MPLMEITIIVAGTGESSASKYIAQIIKHIEKSGLKYEISSMGTTVEGPLDKLFKVAREVHEIPFKMGVPRVITLLKIDDRRDKKLSIEGKIKSLKEKLS